MAINAYGDNLATNGVVGNTKPEVEDKTALGKEDFLTLLLIQLQHQDPTEPADTENILTQTSQLASMEAATNTNKALEKLAASLSSSQEFSTIAAIGKRADLGSDGITYERGKLSKFEMYFPENIESGNIEIKDLKGNLVATIDTQTQKDKDGKDIEVKKSGVYAFAWDGLDKNKDPVEDGTFRVSAKYVDDKGAQQTSRIGAYPIESVRFEDGKTYLKLGSSYIPLENVSEIY